MLIGRIRIEDRVSFLGANYYALKHVPTKHHHFLHLKTLIFRTIMPFVHHGMMSNSINKFGKTSKSIGRIGMISFKFSINFSSHLIEPRKIIFKKTANNQWPEIVTKLFSSHM